jgi:N utilization substance protein A
MSKITYNADLLKIMNLFETLTGTGLKDCFIDENTLLTFVVSDIEIGKAIGKNASNVKRIEALLKRKIKILAFNSQPVQFVRNLIYPVTDVDVELVDKTIIIKGHDGRTKGFLIGREQTNIKNTINIVKKYFKDIETIKVM